MPIVTRHSTITVLVLGLVALLLLGIAMWFGMYNMAADDPHMKVTYNLLETARNRSIAVRASKLQAPADLMSPERIVQGAGNYNAMCTTCHLAPGMAETELSKGLYPAPPNLTKETVDAAAAFWVIKHGIKASGMPAWGKSMSDEYIWNMAAFLQELPKLDAVQYQAMTAKSGGHSHGGGETKPHDDPPGEDHSQMAGMNMDGMPTDESQPHIDAPGAHDKPAADEAKPHVDAPGAHDKPATGKPHTDPPGAPPHGH